MALITAAEARAYLPGLTGTTEDTSLAVFITRASSLIAEYLGWPPATSGADPTIEDATYTLYSGRGRAVVGVVDSSVLRLPVRPLVSVTSVYDDPDRVYGSGQLIASADYDVEKEDGEIILLPTAGHSWSTGMAAIRVICVAGYETVPTWAAHAAGLMTHHLWDLRHTQGRQSVGQGGVSLSLTPETMPEVVREVLSGYRILGAT